ncbi:MAG: response regulator [Rhodospirillales bacterium]|nr:response regulator [Rhodospirillales bacterium]
MSGPVEPPQEQRAGEQRGGEPPGELRIAAPADAGERLRAIGAATAGVAHDVNNLLSGIDAAAALALDRPGLDPETLDDLKEIRRAVTRGATLIRTLLATGTRPPRAARPRPLDPELAAAAAVIRRLLPPSVRFTQRLEAAGCRVAIEPDALHHALLNLALNARDAMPGGGTLVLRSAERVLRTPFPTLPPPATCEFVPAGRYVVVSLRDSGPGISPEIAPRLFESFFTTKPGGSGLGLGQVRERVRAAGGFLALGGRPGLGMVARLFLPLADAAPAPDPASAWLVEDEPVLRRMMQRALQAAGWRVRSAESAEAALGAVGPATARPAVLICDLTLPGMDGLALLRALRRRWPELPAVLVSGYDETALPSGAAFLRKPFALAELSARVAQMARTPSRMAVAGGEPAVPEEAAPEEATRQPAPGSHPSPEPGPGDS